MSGRLEIAASQNLGVLGAKDPEPVVYNWRIVWTVGWAWPFALLLPLFLLKSNRRPAAWLVWLPVVFVLLVSGSVWTAVPEFVTDVNSPIPSILSGLTLGFAAVWLILHKIQGWHRAGLFFAALAILNASAILMALCMGGEFWMLLYRAITCGVSALVVMLAVLGASLLCRRRYTPVRFTAWLFGCAILSALIVFMPFATIGGIMAVSSVGLSAVGALLLGLGPSSTVCWSECANFLGNSVASAPDFGFVVQ